MRCDYEEAVYEIVRAEKTPRKEGKKIDEENIAVRSCGLVNEDTKLIQE